MNLRIRNDNGLLKTKMKKNVGGSKKTIVRKNRIARPIGGQEHRKKTHP